VDSLSGDFSAVFARAIADALRIPVERVAVIRFFAGSVIVEFSVDISESEVAALPGTVQATVTTTEDIGGYALLSVSPLEAATAPPPSTQDDPCAIGDWNSCTVAGQPVVAVVVVGLGASVVLLAVLRKVCCKKRAKVGSSVPGDYAQWN
jgi:hypothetical protein